MRIYMLQKRALRICYGVKKINCCIFSLSHKCSIFEAYKFQVRKFIFSTLKHISPSCFWSFFKVVSDIHNYGTRHTNKLYLSAEKQYTKILCCQLRSYCLELYTGSHRICSFSTYLFKRL